MKVIGVIPARYASSRFPGKPLMDICGKPMVWWVYSQVKKVPEVNEVYVATDDERIRSQCEALSVKCLMTPECPEHISRVQSVSEQIQADYYVCVNGDEPLIDPDSIHRVLCDAVSLQEYYHGAVRKLTDPIETIDSANIKVVLSKSRKGVYMSRTPVPYPKGTLFFSYYKYVGIEVFTKEGLDFFVNSGQGILEKIEDIDHLRFIENGKEICFTEIDSESLSVDTLKDLEKVRRIMQRKLESGELNI